MATSYPSSSNARRPLTVEVSTSYGSQESSGPTPEPSPVGPPKATEYNNHLIEDRSNNNPDNNDQIFRRHNVLLHPLQESDRSGLRSDDGSHENPLAGRRIPSPYSPPPESLISDDERLDRLPAHQLDADEWGIPNRNRGKIRPPLQEVSVEASRRSTGSTRNYNGDRVGNGAPPPPPIGNSFSFEADLQQQLRHLAALQQRSAASPGSASMHTAQASPATHHHIHRSQLLPAVVQLKRELLEAHQSAFLLRREHEASNAKHVEAQNELRSTANRLQEELGALRQSNSDLVRQRAEATEETKMASSAVRTLQAEKEAAEAQLQASLEERNELQAALNDQGQKLESVRASNQELSEGVASLEQKVQNLSNERGDLMQEVKQLRESLGHDNSVAASTILALQSENESLRNDLSVTKGLVERSKEELQESRGLVQSLQEEVKATRVKLKHVLAESTLRANELQEQFDSLQLAERRGRESSQHEIERLKACLKEGELKSAAIEKDAESAKIMLKTEVAGLEKSLRASAAQCAALRGEKLALRKELSVRTQLLQRLESVVTADAACQTDAPVAVHEFGTQTESELHSFGSSLSGSGGILGDGERLADRVGRIRDASDRASLTQAYRREVNRIQEENAADLRRAEESYNASLASVIQDAKSEVHRQTRELKQKLKAEWESKLASLEKQRQRELDQVCAVKFALFNALQGPCLSVPSLLGQARDEFEASMAAADVAVQAAASELTLTQQALERETSRRLQLEQETSSLKVQVELHKQRERDVIQRKDEETKSLLTSIRDECNLAFDRKGVRVVTSSFHNLPAIGSTATLTTSSSGSKSTSPRSVAFSEPSSSPNNHQHSTPAHDHSVTATPKREARIVSSTPRGTPMTPIDWSHSNQPMKSVDVALDETEVLVRSLLG
jgi:hypothetical protein